MAETKQIIQEYKPEIVPIFDNRVLNEDIVKQIYRREQHKDNLTKVARYTLSSAQILALNSTPVTIVPAFLNSLIIVEGIDAKLIFNTTAYTGANNLEFRYTNAGGAKVTADMASTFINSSATAYDHVAGVVTELTPVINTPIVVRVPTANPGTGDSTISLFIRFRLVNY